MAYGMQIFNADGRKQLDTNESYPNTQLKNVTTSAYSAMAYPPSGYVAGDLILARPVNSPVYTSGGYVPIAMGTLNRFYGSQTSTSSQNFQNTAGIVTALLKNQSVGIGAPSTGEYGLDIYDTNGSTLLFSATRMTGVRLLAAGTVAMGSSVTYTPPSSLDFNKIYAVVNGSLMNYIPPVGFPVNSQSWTFTNGYHFFNAASTPYIVVEHKFIQGGSGGSSATGTGTFTYMLVYDPN
jgi:hypothetical protein